MRRAFLIGGVCCLLLAFGLPGGWYDAIPGNPELPPPPMSGMTLLKMSFGLDAILLLWLGITYRAEGRHVRRHRPAPARSEAADATSPALAAALLAALTAVALGLRLWRVDSDLWLDEIAPLVSYGPLSIPQVIGSYLGSNNHLLNTILVKLSVARLGEHAWSVRLPAVVFGAATIPLFYWLARMVLSRAQGLAAALLLAVSYHHIFFSQNGRGYTAYIFFSLLATGLFVKALGDDRPRTWALYVVAAVLSMASLLIAAFVIASHVVVSLGALFVRWRSGREIGRSCRTFAVVFGLVAFLVFQLYALIIPQAYVYMRSVYTQAGSGYALVSREFLAELTRGVLVAFGTRAGWAIVPVGVVSLGLGTWAFFGLARRHWALVASLTLPSMLTGLVVLAGGLTVSPRFFLLVLPLVMLVVVETIAIVLRAVWNPPSWVPSAAAAILSVLLLVPLANYYRTPKQPYMDSAMYVRNERRPGDLVIVVHLAEVGFRYYGPRFGLEEGRRCAYLRSKEAFDAALRQHMGGRVLLVTTFPRALRLEFPDLAQAIDRDFVVDRVFRGTIGDGDISVWKLKEENRGPL